MCLSTFATPDGRYVSAEIHTSNPESPPRTLLRRCARPHAEPIGLRPSECLTAAYRLCLVLSESPHAVPAAPDRYPPSTVRISAGLVFPARARTLSLFPRPLRLHPADSSA